MWVWQKQIARVNIKLTHFTSVRKEVRKISLGLESFPAFLYYYILTLLHYYIFILFGLDIVLPIMKQLKDVMNKEGNNVIDVFSAPN